MVKNILIESISFIGGSTALNFINPVHDYKSEAISDYLLQPVDLIAWGQKIGILNVAEAVELEKFAELNETEALNFYNKSLKIRNLLHDIFQGIITGVPVNEEIIDQFNKIKINYFKHLKIVNGDSGYIEKWHFEKQDLKKILAPVIYDAYELLLSPKQDRIKVCPSCGWMFVARSKYDKSRCCTMQSCGRSAKALG